MDSVTDLCSIDIDEKSPSIWLKMLVEFLQSSLREDAILFLIDKSKHHPSEALYLLEQLDFLFVVEDAILMIENNCLVLLRYALDKNKELLNDSMLITIASRGAGKSCFEFLMSQGAALPSLETLVASLKERFCSNHIREILENVLHGLELESMHQVA